VVSPSYSMKTDSPCIIKYSKKLESWQEKSPVFPYGFALSPRPETCRTATTGSPQLLSDCAALCWGVQFARRSRILTRCRFYQCGELRCALVTPAFKGVPPLT
jgi:hypothetical protein